VTRNFPLAHIRVLPSWGFWGRGVWWCRCAFNQKRSVPERLGRKSSTKKNW